MKITEMSEYEVINCPALADKKIVCLTLDLEQDYGDLLFEPSYEGLEHLHELVSFLERKYIPLTCFVQGSILDTHPEKFQEMSSLSIEFELHSYSHPGPKAKNTEAEVERSKDAYIRFFNRNPMGYRFPLGAIEKRDYKILAEKGFKFDSSVFPTLRPGAFNNLRTPTSPYFFNDSGIVEFPFSVFSRFIRIPVALSYIKLLGRPYLYMLRKSELPQLIVFDFHLHDIFGLSSSRKISQRKLLYGLIFDRIYQAQGDSLALLKEIIEVFQDKGYNFRKLMDVYEVISE